MDSLSLAASVAGIAQLLSSIIKLYEDIFWPLRRCKEWSRDLEHIQRQIRNQRAIFRNECRLMLTSLSSPELAKEMIENHKHPAWADPDLDFKFASHFGASCSIYARVVRSIEEKLVLIGREDVEAHAAPEQMRYFKSITGKIRPPMVQRKIKATFSTSRLSFHVEGLRRVSAEFQALASSTRGRKCSPGKIDSGMSRKLDQRLEELQFVQKASLQLYHALTTACLAHIEHSGYFNLEPDHVSIRDSGPSTVSFSIAFSGCAVDGDSPGLESNWLTIRSAFYETRTEFSEEHDPMTHNPVSAFTSTFAAANDNLHRPIVVYNLKTTKWVRFHKSQASTLRSAANCPIFDNADKSLEESSAGHGFCFYKRSLILRSRGDICIGYLEMAEPTGIWRHLLYVMPRATVAPFHSRESLSLTQLYYSLSPEKDDGHLSIYVRLQLAYKLAIAALYLHSTPWLRQSWGSNDVLFLGINESFVHRNIPLAFPHLKVRVIHDCRNESIIAKKAASVTEEYPYHSNLFNLGILLLELGYFKPLSSLRDNSDFQNCNEKFEDFVLARKLSLTLGCQMGSAYARIVQKCLRCEFGKENDLSDLDTQAIFYQDVVCELERLEKCGKELKIMD